ncbi:MAG: hypothetical protein WC784_04975 [Candidatus Shapirobacteria bacterium]|jgi:hypothetical protein
MNGITIAEIAAELNISTGAVKMRLIRANLQPVSYAGPTGIYPRSVIDLIRLVKGRGRPKGEKK